MIGSNVRILCNCSSNNIPHVVDFSPDEMHGYLLRKGHICIQCLDDGLLAAACSLQNMLSNTSGPEFEIEECLTAS